MISQAPAAGKKSIEVTIRLKRGRLVHGRVLDHNGKPVKGAAVFACGPIRINLYGGTAINHFGANNKNTKPVYTDEDGRFELPAGEATSLAVSYKYLDVWTMPLPKKGEVIFKLPAPAKIKIFYDIPGGNDKEEIFYQLLTHLNPPFPGVESTRNIPIKNGESLTLPAMAPGKYQICRHKTLQLSNIGIGEMLNREFFELKPGETKEIHFVRKSGATLLGKITWPYKTKLSGIIVSVVSEKRIKDPFDNHEYQTVYASCKATAEGKFKTERIPPGRYLLRAEAYVPLTDQQRFSTGFVNPVYRSEKIIEIPETGEVVIPDLKVLPTF